MTAESTKALVRILSGEESGYSREVKPGPHC